MEVLTKASATPLDSGLFDGIKQLMKPRSDQGQKTGIVDLVVATAGTPRFQLHPFRKMSAHYTHGICNGHALKCRHDLPCSQ
ncbi:MAG: hypothetical protein ABS69_17845 [Nitrosomonadales bacterium SCN 54-20]|nr:MAG: hypothetical protein ABS69_17845 [Nitrosomonadales bacterium SCN 54-20]